MKRISAHLLIALLTFAIGVAAFAVRHFVRSQNSESSESQQVIHITATPATADEEPRFAVKYENTAIAGGLFHVVRNSDGYVIDSSDGYDARSLVLPYSDKLIKHKADDPKSPTRPGFYLPYNVRFDFERVEAIGKKVEFTTRLVDGARYEFSGVSGKELIPHFKPPTRVPFIEGILTRVRDGKVTGEEEIKFRYTVSD